MMNSFTEQTEQKEDKTKQILNLDHAMVLTDTATKLQKTLYSFGVSAKVENVSVGPAITRYELKPAEGVRVNKIANLADDIALNLAAESIRIEAPIPGKTSSWNRNSKQRKKKWYY